MQGRPFKAELNSADASGGEAVPLYESGSFTAYTLQANEYLEIHMVSVITAPGGAVLLFTGANKIPVSGTYVARGTFKANDGISQRLIPPHVGRVEHTLWVYAPVGTVDVLIRGMIRKAEDVTVWAPVSAGLAAAILGTQSSDLLAYYKCDDLSGNLVDSSPNGYDASMTGSPVYGVAGQLGNAITFGGDPDMAVYNHGSALLTDDVDGFTSMALVNPTDGLGDYHFWGFGWEGSVTMKNFASSRAKPATPTQFHISWSDSGGASAIGTVAGTVFSTGNWKLVTFRFASLNAGGDDKGHISTNDTHIIHPTNLRLTFGFNGVSSDCLGIGGEPYSNAARMYGKSTLQHVAFWKKTLTDGEIDAIAAETLLV